MNAKQPRVSQESLAECTPQTSQLHRQSTNCFMRMFAVLHDYYVIHSQNARFHPLPIPMPSFCETCQKSFVRILQSSTPTNVSLKIRAWIANRTLTEAIMLYSRRTSTHGHILCVKRCVICSLNFR